MSADGTELGPLDHLLAVSEGKPFQNLSWRLMQLLVKGVHVERRELGEGDRLKVTEAIDVIYVERGGLDPVKDHANQGKAQLSAGSTGTHNKALAGTVELATSYEAREDTVLRVFYRIGEEPSRVRKKRRRAKAGNEAGAERSRWTWLCDRSVVARRALHKNPGDLAEVVLLQSKDLVEYLPALTELLAQAVACGDQSDEPTPVVRLVRFDPGSPTASEWSGSDADHRVELRLVSAATKLAEAINNARAGATYVFVDPYDRAGDIAAIPIKALTTRSRVADSARASGARHAVVEHWRGSTLDKGDLRATLAAVHSLVHVARNFRLDTADEDDDKLNFHAVILDSRTARFEAGGTRDRQQRRNADDPLQTKVDPPEGTDDGFPTTRLHLNLLRLKKAWEQSASLSYVCDVLDEPNVPGTGDRRGYWSARSFFDRWVRDLRFRRVGVALGGGGATGFSHVALIQALREERIPIDLVSGTSFGALVGAYYCSHGLDGLSMLVQQSLLYSGAASLTIFTSALFEHLVNLSIDYRPMWELPIPFYAVATDIETGSMVVFPGPAAANPSVGFAVRASGSLPGFFAPAIAGDARYVDGGAVSIVPVKALIRFGADLVIGSNAFPFRKADGAYRASPLRALLPPPFGKLAERVIAELNPGNRMTDAARSLSLSLTSGMEREKDMASAVYEHKRTDVKYWEFHRAAGVLRAARQDLVTSGTLPAAINAHHLLNSPVDARAFTRRPEGD